MGRATDRLIRRSAMIAGVVLFVGCSGDDGGSDASVPLETNDATTVVSSTVASESRPVPTVPVSSEPGVINASPTIVAETSAPIDPDAPRTTVVPPTTELVGDPQPSPNTTRPPPPPTVEAPPSACDRLIDFGVTDVVAEAGGVPAGVDALSESACRLTSGSITADVEFVTQAEVRDDWYQRAGIEPVGEVSGEAVGLNSGDGYTIALVGGQQGVIVSVQGTGDARFVAGQVAIFANQAA